MSDRYAMRLRELLTESWRNVISGASRFVPVSVALALSALLLLAAEGTAIRGAVDEAMAYRSAGASITFVGATGAIDPVVCEAVGAVDGFAAGGAIRAADEPLLPRALPGSQIPAFDVTPGFGEMLGVERSSGGIVLSEPAASRLGLVAGDLLPLVSGSARIAAVFAWPDDGRRPALGYAALIPAPVAGVFDECWLDAWPESASSAGMLRSVLMSERIDPSVPPSSGAINDTLGSHFRGADRFDDRVTRFAPALGFFVGAGSAALAIWSRRLAIAADQHFGVRRLDVVLRTLIETSIALLPGVISVIFAVLVMIRSAPGAEEIVALALRGPLGVVAGALVAGALMSFTIRSRDMLRHFRAR